MLLKAAAEVDLVDHTFASSLVCCCRHKMPTPDKIILAKLGSPEVSLRRARPELVTGLIKR